MKLNILEDVYGPKERQHARYHILVILQKIVDREGDVVILCHLSEASSLLYVSPAVYKDVIDGESLLAGLTLRWEGLSYVSIHMRGSCGVEAEPSKGNLFPPCRTVGSVPVLDSVFKFVCYVKSLPLLLPLIEECCFPQVQTGLQVSRKRSYIPET